MDNPKPVDEPEEEQPTRPKSPWPRPPLRESDIDRTPTYVPPSEPSPPTRPAQQPRAPGRPESSQTIRRPPPLRDPDATRVQSGGIPGQTRQAPPTRAPVQKEQPTPRRTYRPTTPRPVYSRPRGAPQPKPKSRWPARIGCIFRGVVYSALLVVVLFFLGLAAVSIGYVAIASELPPPGELTTRAADFATSYILDSEGNLLYELIPPDAGRRERVPLSRISPLLIQATIATEDRNFYQHPGFDPFGIARAVVQNLRQQEIVSGASTITQQLARALLLSPEERAQETATRKIREIILAAEITRRYSKEEILEIYLNEINYGNLAYGIEAAAQTYFQKPAADLDLSEASLLAGLPQAPAAWDPYVAPELALGRQGEVLGLMIEAGFISPEEKDQALAEMTQRIDQLIPPHVEMVHPHFVNYVRQELEARLGPQSTYRQGVRIYTTLHPVVQATAESVVAEFKPHLANWGADNTALVAVQPETGYILAMVGSADFYSDAIDGQVNMALAGRQPGSAIKPLTYVTAFEKGWTPSTLIWDVPTTFTNEWGQTYTPKNYDNRFHGPTLLRGALANSYNLPAVKALNSVGVCDFISRANGVGILSLQDTGCDSIGKPSDYWLALTLGGGEVTPLEMVSFYAALATNGVRQAPVSIARIEDLEGNPIYEYAPRSQQVIRPEHAYLINDILADNAGRIPAFGADNRLQFADRRVAVKTGTSGTDENDVRDAWTIGHTPQVAVVVWAGNTDNTPMATGASGYQVAAPIWRAFMDRTLAGWQVIDFPRPEGIVQMEVCADSGTQPSADCPADRRRWELFVADQPPLGPEYDFYRRKYIDLWTGLEANQNCTEAVEEQLFVVIEDEGGRRWVEETAAGRQWAADRGIVLEERPGDPSPRLRQPPTQACALDTPRPRVRLTSPAEGQTVTGELILYGEVSAPNMTGYRVEYGVGLNPIGWGLVQDWVPTPVHAGEVARWDTSETASGEYTLRVIIAGPLTRDGAEIQYEQRIHINILNPTTTPTPTETATPTPTSTSTPTATPTGTATPSATPSVSPTPSDTPTPSPTPSEGPSPAPTPTPTETKPPPDTPTPTTTPTPSFGNLPTPTP
jgi:penicillin-binding protein 1C